MIPKHLGLIVMCVIFTLFACRDSQVPKVTVSIKPALNHTSREAPSASNQFDCVFLSISGSGVNETHSTLSNSVDESCLDLGSISTVLSVREYRLLGLSAQVTSGFSRKIRILGMEMPSGECPNRGLDEIFGTVDPEIYVISEMEIDLFEDQSIALSNDYASSSVSDLVAACPQTGAGQGLRRAFTYRGASRQTSGSSWLAVESFFLSSGNLLPPIEVEHQPSPMAGDPMKSTNITLGEFVIATHRAGSGADHARLDFFVEADNIDTSAFEGLNITWQADGGNGTSTQCVDTTGANLDSSEVIGSVWNDSADRWDTTGVSMQGEEVQFTMDVDDNFSNFYIQTRLDTDSEVKNYLVLSFRENTATQSSDCSGIRMQKFELSLE